MTPPDPGDGIRVCRIRRSFGPVHAVQGIDLDAPPGQDTALVAPGRAAGAQAADSGRAVAVAVARGAVSGANRYHQMVWRVLLS